MSTDRAAPARAAAAAARSAGRRPPLLAAAAHVAVRPARAFERVAGAAPGGRAAPAGLVVGAGVVAALLSALSTLLEPGDHRAAGYGISAVLPLLFVAVWLVDGLIVDAVAQVMGTAARLCRWLAASALAIPVLAAFDAVRVLQALLDHAGADDLGTALGFLDFAVLGWFVWVVTVGIAAVYGLPRLSAFAAALAPPATMATVLLLLLVVGSAVAGGS